MPSLNQLDTIQLKQHLLSVYWVPTGMFSAHAHGLYMLPSLESPRKEGGVSLDADMSFKTRLRCYLWWKLGFSDYWASLFVNWG